MECSCNAGSVENESQYNERYRKSSKGSLCPECNQTIKRGDLYLFGTVIGDDGKFSYTYKLCEVCVSIVENFFQGGFYIGTVIPSLKDYLCDSWSEDLPSSCISKLHPKARDLVCDFLQRYQEY